MDIIPFISEPIGDSSQELGRQFVPIKYELETSDTEAGCCKFSCFFLFMKKKLFFINT